MSETGTVFARVNGPRPGQTDARGVFDVIDLSARVAYLQGLAEGLHVDEAGAEGRVLAGVIQVMGEMAEAVESVLQAHDDLAEQVEAVDADVESLLCDCDNDGDTIGEQEIVFVPDGGTIENRANA